MEPCTQCGAEAYEVCEPDCLYWDERYDEIFDFQNSLTEDIDEVSETEWK